MKDSKIFVQHILESITYVELYMKGASKEEFRRNVQLQDAIIRRLEVIGEAAKNLPKEFTDEYKSVPWKDIVGARDKLIHHYFGVDLELTFEIVKIELPKLKKEIKKILEDIGK